MKILKKQNKVQFTSEEFSACMVVSPLGYCCDVSEVGVRHHQVLSMSGPQQHVWSCQ